MTPAKVAEAILPSKRHQQKWPMPFHQANKTIPEKVAEDISLKARAIVKQSRGKSRAGARTEQTTAHKSKVESLEQNREHQSREQEATSNEQKGL